MTTRGSVASKKTKEPTYFDKVLDGYYSSNSNSDNSDYKITRPLKHTCGRHSSEEEIGPLRHTCGLHNSNDERDEDESSITDSSRSRSVSGSRRSNQKGDPRDTKPRNKNKKRCDDPDEGESDIPQLVLPCMTQFKAKSKDSVRQSDGSRLTRQCGNIYGTRRRQSSSSEDDSSSDYSSKKPTNQRCHHDDEKDKRDLKPFRRPQLKEEEYSSKPGKKQKPHSDPKICSKRVVATESSPSRKSNQDTKPRLAVDKLLQPKGRTFRPLDYPSSDESDY